MPNFEEFCFIDPLKNSGGFKQVSVGKSQVWVTTSGGAILRREGICAANPVGSGWSFSVQVSF